MDMEITLTERKNRKISMVLTSIIMTGLFALLFIKLMSYEDPPPGQEGILVNLGIPDVGQGNENAPEPTAPQPSEPTPAEPIPVEPERPEPEPEPVRPEPAPKPEPVSPPEVIKTEDPAAIALRKKREEERKRKDAEARERREREQEAQRERDRERRAQEEAERKRQQEEARKRAEAEAERKRQEEAARKAQEAKDKYSGAFGGGNGPGKGNTGTAGNQGDPNGDPNSDVLEGTSVGTGRVGGGLGSRGVRAAPKVRDSSQETGVINLSVCVDSNGKVVSAEFTLQGSTSQSRNLINKAIANAKRWKFSEGTVDKQCGFIKYDFRVQ